MTTLYEPAAGGVMISNVTGVDASGNLTTSGTRYQTTGQFVFEGQQAVARQNAIDAANTSPFGAGLAELVTNPLGFITDGTAVLKDVATTGLSAIDSAAKLVEAVALLAGVGLAAFLVYKTARVIG